MIKKKNYKITRSNYTLKKKHKYLGNDSVIYERDFMITNNGQTWSGDNSPYGTSSFKMVNNSKGSGSYKYNSGGWLKTPKCNDETHDYGDKWCLNCIPNKNEENSENNIHIKPNTTSLLSFAYYGSTKDLIKNSINDIIDSFPAEIVFTDYKDNKGRYKVENSFLIDLHTVIVNKDESSNLRFFIQNCEKYRVLIYNESAGKELSYPITHCETEDNIIESCAKEGDLLYITKIYSQTSDVIEVKCYYENRKCVYYTDKYYGLRIRPHDDYIEFFFNNLNAFQKNMLNRWTTPKYKMTLDFPHETENGIETYKKYFIWPLKHTLINGDKARYASWNIDIETREYETYLKTLLKLCDFYDERCTNNLWRSLTHESIKNMDYAFKDDKIEDDEYSLGEGRFEEIIKCFANQFDVIKQYIDNIKTSNTITYSNDNNLPAYFLSDKLEYSGWEVYNLANVLDETQKVDNYSVSDTNINMMKHLQINSKEILAHKGTRHGIEMLLGLFGLKSYDVDKENYDYKLTEYVHTITDDTNADYNSVIYFNSEKQNFTETLPDGSYNVNRLQGLPIRGVYMGVDESGYDQYYLIPWFDKNETLDGNIYFQMYGGWGKSFTKELANTSNLSDDLATSENIQIYNETIKNLIAVRSIKDLKDISNKIHKNCVAFVYDINDFDYEYEHDSKTNITLDGENGSEKATNYFILNDVNNSFKIGSYTNENETYYGWVNITENDITNNTDKGIRVKLLESVVENHKGNNPHGGFGKYDDGETYIDYFRQFFKYTLENNMFTNALYDCENGLLNPDIKNIGFEIEKQRDNVKTWYFTNINNNDENNKLLELTLNEDKGCENCEVIYKGIKYKNINNINYNFSFSEQNNVNVGAEASGYTFFESDVKPYNFEGYENYDEAAANSIINNKNLLIEFSRGLMDNSTFPRFLQECILPYLIQIIPSTTIWEVRLEGDYAVYTENKIKVNTIDE